MAHLSESWGGWDEDVRDDPFPLFERVRLGGPVHSVRLSDGHAAWLVIGHDAARQALMDPRFSKDMLAARSQDPDVVADGLPGPEFARHMLAVDPPDHTRLRRLVAPAFSPRRVASMRPTIEALAHRLLDDLAATGPVVDLVAGYAMPLPFGVIGALLGVPTETQPRLRDGFRTLLQPWKGDPPPEAVAASDDIVATLTELVESHRQTPSDDLIGVLVTPAEDGERLSDQEILSSLFQLIVAGHDTTSSLIGSGVVALLDHPEQRRLLLESPEAIHAAVEELVRYTAPVPHATFRVTTEAVVLDGVEIPAHQQVLICLAGANRDPVVRADPHRLDVTRPPRHHLGFGHGIHHCLGAALARLEVEVAFEVLFGRHPNVRLAVERADLHWSHGDGLVLRGLAELPVRLAAA